MQLRQRPDPVLAAGKVLIDVKAIGVNPVDTYIRAGKYGPKEFPYTPGTDAAGVVMAIGTGVEHCAPGDRVYVYGGEPGAYADRMLCEAARVYPLPDSMSFEQGAAIGVPYATAYRAAFIRGNAMPAETVLVHGGTGGVGLAAVQLLRRDGLTVFATGGSEKGLKLVRDHGANLAFDHRTSNYRDEILRATNGNGVDLILEMLANVNLGHDLAMLNKHGRVVVIGSRDTVTIDPREMMKRDSDIRGMSLMHSDSDELKQIHSALGAGFSDGTLVPVIDRTFALPDAGAAHEAVMQDGSHGKIVLKP